MVTRSCTAQIAVDVAARYGCAVDPACVQILPVGATSIKLPVWNGTRLTDPDFKETEKRGANSGWARFRNGPLATERRLALPALVAEGMTDLQLAYYLDVPVATIVYDRGRLGLRANHGLTAQRRAKVAQIAAVACGGLTVRQIADATGIHWKSVQVICREQGLPVAGRGAQLRADVDQVAA